MSFTSEERAIGSKKVTRILKIVGLAIVAIVVLFAAIVGARGAGEPQPNQPVDVTQEVGLAEDPSNFVADDSNSAVDDNSGSESVGAESETITLEEADLPLEDRCNEDLIVGWEDPNAVQTIPMVADYPILRVGSDPGTVDSGTNRFVASQGFVAVSLVSLTISDVAWNTANEHYNTSACAVSAQDSLEVLARFQQDEEKPIILFIDSEGVITEWDQDLLYEAVDGEETHMEDLIATSTDICNGELLEDWETPNVTQFDVPEIPGYGMHKISSAGMSVNGVSINTGFTMVAINTGLSFANFGDINPITGNYDFSICALFGEFSSDDADTEIAELQDRELKEQAIIVNGTDFSYVP